MLLAAEASRLADQLSTEADAVVLGACDDGLVRTLGSRGASRVFLASVPAAPLPDADACVPLLVDLIREHQPGIVLWPATSLSRELAPRVAARLGTGLASACTDLDVGSDGLLRMSRAVYGGRASAIVLCPQARPQMATLDARYSARRYSGPAREAQVTRVEASGAAIARSEVQGIIQGDPLTMDLAEADVIVAGGRGVGGGEGFELLMELASLLGGAVAASRPAVDAGWVPYHRQVGQSGRTVAPSLYVACGISGAPHHAVGMREARTVLAINTDGHAPIFDLADLAVVADVREVLPPLLARLREKGAETATAAAATLDDFARR